LNDRAFGMELSMTTWVFLQWRIAGVVGIQIADFVVVYPGGRYQRAPLNDRAFGMELSMTD
jgi:hypothetical protein